MILFSFGVGLVLGILLGAAMILFARFNDDPVPEDDGDPPMGVGA